MGAGQGYVAAMLRGQFRSVEGRTLDAALVETLVARLEAMLPRLAVASLADESGIDPRSVATAPRLTAAMVIRAMEKASGTDRVIPARRVSRQPAKDGRIAFTFSCTGRERYDAWWHEAVRRDGADRVAERIAELLRCEGVFPEVTIGHSGGGGFPFSLAVRWAP